jgi:outer membrane receptor for ferric coprogen and ferric-rhodotorulic acid
MQWINLFVGGDYWLIGGNKDFRSYYGLNSNPVYAVVNNVATSQVVQVGDLKPESVTSFEIGYKGLNLNENLLVDVYAYYGQYQDFLTRRLVIQNPTNAATVRKFSIPLNSSSKVKTYGFGIGLDYKLPLNFTIGANFSSDNLTDVPAGFQASFNSPKYRTNLKFANLGFGKDNRIGFSVIYKWMDSYHFDSDFIVGEVPAVNTLDAQVSYKIPQTRSVLKIGGSNILNQYYVQGPGNPAIGGIYYVSFAYNVF